MSCSYIINLTNNLISKNGYARLRMPSAELVRHIAVDLDCGNLRKMCPETLGKIMGALDIGDVMATKEEIFKHVTFSGDCEDLLRELVASCLAYVIRDRLQKTHLTPYKHPRLRVSGIDGW